MLIVVAGIAVLCLMKEQPATAQPLLTEAEATEARHFCILDWKDAGTIE